MENLVKELGIPSKNIFTTPSNTLFTVVVHSAWIKKWLKNTQVENIDNVDFPLQPSESVVYPYRKIFIRVLSKTVSKVLPLPRYKHSDGNIESPLTYAQLLQYVSQSNHRNLWKESYKKYCHNTENTKETTIVNLMEHNQLLFEVILRLYGCHIIKIRNYPNGKVQAYKEILPNKFVSKYYETHANLLAAMYTLETDDNFYIIYNSHYENNLLDCLNFSPNLIDKNYARSLFIVYQILNVAKAMSDRGLSIGALRLEDIYLSENLWLQVAPAITNNVHTLDPSLIYEHNRNKPSTSLTQASSEENRNNAVQLEKLCQLWVRGRISNLDYLIHLNTLAGRKPNDPQAYYIVPWVTDFSSRYGKNWCDLTKSKYRLTKGDRQLDLTYEVTSQDENPDQVPHHVTDTLSDITCYVYLARRTPKDVLCKYVRNKWVPAEYPASIQRMMEWTPDECIPEFYTDPLVFKSIHEDLPDLGIPSWATCIEDFVTKHREAFESAHVSENLHHWIDLTFGYKLSGGPAVKAKNVCLSLVDGHTKVRKGAAVQLLYAPHPPKMTRPHLSAPPRLQWMLPNKKSPKTNDSSDAMSDEDDESTSGPQHVSRLSVPSQQSRSRHDKARHKSGNRARSLSKHHDHEVSVTNERASSHSRHYKVQKSELGKGVIYLPKEYNPVSAIQALENMDNFRTKCFFSNAKEEVISQKQNTPINLFESDSSRLKSACENSFTNHMFMASYEQNYMKKFTQETHIGSVFKKNRAFNNRYTTDATIYKQFVTESRRRDMIVIGCLIVEIFLHTHMRPLRVNDDSFVNRYNSCQTVLKYNFQNLPRCVRYIASLLLNVQPLSLSTCTEFSMDDNTNCMLKNIIVTDKGLPPPTPSQLLQPLLSQHLIPFPESFKTLYSLLMSLHEYQLCVDELNELYTYKCDGVQCDKYQSVDKTKMHFTRKIAEGKVHTCASHLDALLKQSKNNQFDVFDIFLSHYIGLLENRDTSVLAAWYLFDTVSKALGPSGTRLRLLKYILNLYEDDEFVIEKKENVNDSENYNFAASKQKFVKLYHNIFLLQLMVRLGLNCFLDNFTQHLVEAVGGYKDVGSRVGSPGHLCHDRTTTNKKLRYSDDIVKNPLNTASDIFSPDTSYGSEIVVTPNVERNENEGLKDSDSRSENELFHFESDKEAVSRNTRSKSPTESISSSTLSVQQDNVTPSPTAEAYSPQMLKESPNSMEDNKKIEVAISSPTIDIPTTSMFTSYVHFGGEDVKDETESKRGVSKSLDVNLTGPSTSKMHDGEELESDGYRISDMASESLLWLSHRLGPVLTCRYITRNLLKMLTLCYIGNDNLVSLEVDYSCDEFDMISIANSKVAGDRNAMKVIECLTSIVAMYGEQLILFQYLPHMGELIASCRRRLSQPLEGGVIACLQLLKYLVPLMSDAKLMEQLQDTFLKSILHPTLRLLSTTRCTFPNGVRARTALARKFLDAIHVLAVRIGPEMTRKHLCVPALQRFFLTFDKASGKTDNWPKNETEVCSDTTISSQTDAVKNDGFLEICRDGSTAEWSVRDGRVVRDDAPPDLSCSPPTQEDSTRLTAQEELLMVFNEELAHNAYVTFMRFVGNETLERSLKNNDTIQALCVSYDRNNVNSPPCNIIHDKRVQSSLSDGSLTRKIDIESPKSDAADHISNSFGSNVTVVGNRIDVTDAEEQAHGARNNALEVVAYKGDAVRTNRHLRGNWLIYWEHEIGRPDKETKFNLKQIKLQQFAGHTHNVKSIHCLDNECSFMSGSKDKTIKLWSLRNQGDGSAISQCNWTYAGHKKGVLSLTFLETLRLAVSTDSVVHVWDPFMETVVSQLENSKSAVSIVRTLPGPSTAVVCATTDATLKVIDARTCTYTHDLKLPGTVNTFIRCLCVSPSGRWVACGLASGHLTVIEPRTGMPIAHWKAHDGEVLRLAAVDEKRLLSSGLDQVTAIWGANDGELVMHLKGTTEPVHCLSVHNQEVITGTTNNRIGVHSLQDSSYNSSKLRADSFKGVLTSMAVLPLNRLLLLGSDNGTITLLC